ncbi:NADH-quinone oxidoreductase subunit J [Bartonella ancashensis]|uniref:NADH-quinone oxidoreductase subunit J n=1 Tax=Bartonella ancashensis TaxID=1318743 RepID=A0A0M4M3Z7_9HYPH|nr:NADH-quinone oxidoreductase subunit J [Bartonella ancashensis]ALE03812.1 NADH-ubiquinone oxidoreductase chain J [Bartonella ancashensis]
MLTGLAAAFFYLFSFIMLVSALIVVFARNPVHSVLFLILAFFNAAALFLLVGAEFVGLILLVVYVGAVAVLFLFVVMMLDIGFISPKKATLQYSFIGAFVGVVIAVELVIVFVYHHGSFVLGSNIIQPIPDIKHRTNTEALGDVLYTDYIFYFQTAGMILLVAMIGAIVLTLRHKSGVKRQSISAQVSRKPEDTIELKKVESRKGV